MDDTIEFQIFDWMEDHEKTTDDDSDTESPDGADELSTYIIHSFGRTLEGKSVYMKIVNYTPHFYIKLPLNWTKDEAKINIQKMYTYFTSDMNKKVWKKFRSALLSMDMIERMSAEGFTNGKLFLFARLVFNNMVSMKKFKYMFEESTVYIPGITAKAVQFKTYEANLPPMLRCFHIRKIGGCSWVSVTKYITVNPNIKESYCDIEVRVDWRNVNPITKDTNAPLRILSFDIECYTTDDKFPQAKRKGDHIIQIGSTYTYLNHADPYRQHIVCLRKTDPVDNVIVEWFDDEGDMMRAWIKEVIEQDCDIITGYNIFGFDEGYIYDRCVEHLNLVDEISKMSKLKYHMSRFKDFKLESSALGQNKIRMFETPGRIHIDLMKDVQKSYKLNSYKLDLVASNFIRNEIYRIDAGDVIASPASLRLYCDGVDSINVNDFIHIEYVLDFISEMVGYKYIVDAIDRVAKTITLKSAQLLESLDQYDYSAWCATENRKNRKFKLYWSQAKDDIGPKDIFRMFNGTSAERAIVAKYCIKDCKLVNLLIDKLCVVTNNIEMSNVCYVPMSFLFTRGQLIKLFSLCLKNYRDAGYLFPVLKRPEEKTPSYEGAIVFEPEPTVEYEALPVKDYASLYPSSIIHKNMSHETLVRNDKYDDMENVHYYNASFRDHDGTMKYKRFAKCNDTLGVIPTTLSNLIKERNAVKKQMKTISDPFKQKILDGKQLALKTTANSLYGALGADVSPIFERDIAACTTSTGREMLKLAKHFDENIIPSLLNGYKYALLDGNVNKANTILNWEMKNPDDIELKNRITKYITKDIANYCFQPIIRYGDTDSIFSCYRFRENAKRVKDMSALSLWKDIIRFSRILLCHFIPVEERTQWNELHMKYYNEEQITELIVPRGPLYVPPPSHYRTLLPIKDRMEQFMLHYMEESFMPWLWTVQDIFTKSHVTDKAKQCALENKLICTGVGMVESMCLVAEITNELKEIIIEDVEYFMSTKLKTYILQPYWDIDTSGNKIVRVAFYKNGTKIIDKRTLALSIEMGILTGELVKKRLPFPHDLEYEKTYWPFLILTKKRYVGNKYEFNPDKYKQDYNGIVLKRRDNAPIVKEICGGIINCLINEKNPAMAKDFTINCIEKMFNNEYNIKYFLTSKTLKMKEGYSDWTKIAHVVLADRIAKRDPGNCPQSGDRIEYAAVEIANSTKFTLQGERIETPQYISENKLKIDYEFYMINQIMNPALQFLALVIPNADGIFDHFKMKIENKKKGRSNILNFCKKKS